MQTDEVGIVTKVNLIVGTTNNYVPISMSINKAARGLIKKGQEVTEGTLKMTVRSSRNLIEADGMVETR